MSKLLHIVPNLPPELDGVGDYSFLLAEELKKRAGVESSFLVCNQNYGGTPAGLNFEVNVLPERSVSSLTTTLENLQSNYNKVILHFVGYGYSKRGVPFWLERGLRNWKRINPDLGLITFFHEIAASGRPWQSSFWLRPFQVVIAKQLSHISERCITSNALSASQLLEISPLVKQVTSVMPIVSNVGECASASPLSERERHLVIFGTRGRRARVYEKESLLNRLVTDLQVTEIHDVGPKLDISLPSFPDVKINELGVLTPQRIMEIYSRSSFGIVDYPALILGKSAIFASYCGAGIVPIVVGSDHPQGAHDGLIPGYHYLLPEHSGISATTEHLHPIAVRAHEWYLEHSLTKHAESFTNWLKT